VHYPSITVTKQYIILADALHGTQFLVWREVDASLILLARDADWFSATATGMLKDGHQLGMVISDDQGNLEQLVYNPRRTKRSFISRLFFFCRTYLLTCSQTVMLG
jgi:hypothetical protein